MEYVCVRCKLHLDRINKMSWNIVFAYDGWRCHNDISDQSKIYCSATTLNLRVKTEKEIIQIYFIITLLQWSILMITIIAEVTTALET